jgi:arylsulfatase A-like enzyme
MWKYFVFAIVFLTCVVAWFFFSEVNASNALWPLSTAFGINLQHYQKSQYFCKGCNLIVLDIDILRADSLDCQQKRGATPFLCSLADKSLFFNNHRSHSDLTRPSIESFLTSTYPVSHGVWNDTLARSPEINFSLMQVLAENGINSYGTLDPANTQLPLEGFISFKDEEHKKSILTNEQNSYFYYYYTDMLHFPYLNREFPESKYLQKIHPDFKNYQTFQTLEVEHLIANIDEYITPLGKKAYANLFNEPEVNKAAIVNLYNSWLSKVGERNKYTKKGWTLVAESAKSYINVSDQQHVSLLQDEYLHQLQLVDSNLKLLFEQNEIDLKRTVVVLRSDHGEEFMEHGQISHNNNFYEEIIRVPFFIYIPNLDRKVEYHGLSQTVDEAPTLLSILGITSPAQFQGYSLLSDFFTSQNTRDFAMGQKSDGGSNSLQYYMKNSTKLIIKKNAKEIEFEMYSLTEDPKEKRTIYEQNIQMAQKMYVEYLDRLKTLITYNSKQLYFNSEGERKHLFEHGYF